LLGLIQILEDLGYLWFIAREKDSINTGVYSGKNIVLQLRNKDAAFKMMLTHAA